MRQTCERILAAHLLKGSQTEITRLSLPPLLRESSGSLRPLYDGPSVLPIDSDFNVDEPF